jgi:two-component system OmpR family response regulator
MRVLIVEDETKMAGLLRRALAEESHLADVAGEGETAVAMARASDYDAIVMDVMLPGIDGITACRRIREASVWTPLLLLTARDAVADRVAGLDSGADDYLTKPFSFDELLARLRALVRRGETPRPTIVAVGDLRTRSSSPRRSSRCSRRSCAAPGSCSRGPACSSTPGITASTTART